MNDLRVTRKKIRVNTGYKEEINTIYHRDFTVEDGYDIPKVGDTIEGEEIVEVEEVMLDPEQPNDSVYNYNYYDVSIIDTEGEEGYYQIAVEITDSLYGYLEDRKENYPEIECYVFTDKKHSVHTDTIKSIVDERVLKQVRVDRDGQGVDMTIYYYEMDEEEYNNTILANSCISADFDDWYDDADAEVLVVVLPETFTKALIQ